ncbi:hypothetical protein YC2023_078885 [Brassica napus]
MVALKTITIKPIVSPIHSLQVHGAADAGRENERYKMSLMAFSGLVLLPTEEQNSKVSTQICVSGDIIFNLEYAKDEIKNSAAGNRTPDFKDANNPCLLVRRTKDKTSIEINQCATADQLMLHTGIGPRSYLSTWRIPVALDQPHVGGFVNDKPRNGVTIGPPVPMANSLIQVVGITEEGASLEAASRYILFSSELQDKTQLLVSTGLLRLA